MGSTTAAIIALDSNSLSVFFLAFPFVMAIAFEMEFVDEVRRIWAHGYDQDGHYAVNSTTCFRRPCLSGRRVWWISALRWFRCFLIGSGLSANAAAQVYKVDSAP